MTKCYYQSCVDHNFLPNAVINLIFLTGDLHVAQFFMTILDLAIMANLRKWLLWHNHMWPRIWSTLLSVERMGKTVDHWPKI